MFHVTLKGLLSHKLRFVLTALSISLGVAFLAGTMIYTATIRRTFDDMLAETNQHIDGLVRSTSSTPSVYGDQRDRIDESLVDLVRAVPGVDGAVPGVSGYAQVVGKDGKALGGFGPPTLGLSWASDSRLNESTIVAGNEPHAGEVVLDRASVTNGRFVIGDRVKILTRGGPEEFVLVGAARYGSADSPAGATLAFFDFETAKRLVGEPGQVDNISVTAAEGVSRTELRDRIQAALPAEQHLEAITGDQLVEETQTAIESGMGFFSTFMLVFAAIALFVATFIINNTFSILVAQRTRELALLRALGASRAQVRASVVGEAMALGVVASIAGLGLGVGLAMGLKGLLSAIGMNLPTTGLAVPVTTVWASFGVGVLVTVAASLLPARRASRIPPMAAMAAAATESPPTGNVRPAIGGLLLIGGTIAVVATLATATTTALTPVALGSLAAFVGVAVLAPRISGPVVAVLGAPFARFRGEAGRLARQNALRNPRRTAATSSALMIGVALVATITIIAASTRASVDASIDAAMRADFIVVPVGSAAGFGPTGFSPDVHAQVAALPDVAVASPVRLGIAKVADQTSPILGIDPATFTQVIDPGRVAGSLEALGARELAVSERAAQEHGWKLGDSIAVAFSSERTESMRLVAIYERRDAVQDHLISIATAKEFFREDLDFELIVKLKDGVVPSTGKAAIARITDAYANLQLLDQTAFKADREASVNQLLGLVYALLFLSIVIALIGIANTLALSIHERQHELGLLRALGMTRGQVRASVRYESVVIALLGSALGLAAGLGIGIAVTLGLKYEGVSRLVVPTGELVVIAALAAVAGVVAAISPARRAARVDILRAVGSE
jgi:putative ABC transport system permease protein